MDILYTVGENSGHDNMELRWSLRSLAKYAKNLGKIIVAGYPPFWLSDDIIRFPAPRALEDKHKFPHILRQVLYVARSGLINGDFLLSSDDHFLSKEFDLEKTPFYKKQDHIQKFEDLDSNADSFKKYVSITGDILRKHGYSDVLCNFHKNTRLNSSVADEVKALVDSEKTNPYNEYGYESTILFQNVYAKHHEVCFQESKDWKIDKYNQEAIDSGAFSISDKAFKDKEFLDYMTKEFGQPCIFEKYY